MILQFGVGAVDPLLAVGLRIAGLSLLSGVVAGAFSVAFRWYARQRMPVGVSMMTGAAIVAVYLNTTGALSQLISGTSTILTLPVVTANLATFLVATVVAVVGGRLGDWIAFSAFTTGTAAIDTDLSQIVQTVGRVITVSLPDEIETIEGYDPVDSETVETLRNRNLVFPRGLSVGELRTRLVTRLKTEYDVGHVDVELTPEGEVSYLALGSRVAGIGPTLPPRTKAVAVRADPPFSASAGDRIQLWRAAADADGTQGFERVLTAEFRGRHDDAVTLAVDEADVDRLVPDARYRLVTLPAEPRTDREFAAMLRRNDETMGVVEVGPGHSLVGAPVSSVDGTVVAVASGDERVEPIPKGDYLIAQGDTVYVLTTPEKLRRLSQSGTDAGAPPSAEPT